MSMLQRLVRAFETMSNVEVSSQDRGGRYGEDYAEAIIDDGQNGCSIRNPIIPHPKKRGFFLETDFLVHMRGTLYCVEIKNYRGKVYYPSCYRTIYVKKGWFIFQRRVPQAVFDRYDYTKMIQEKQGHRGEGTVRLEVPNPLHKTQRYVEDLKRYLARIDSRIEQLPIYPVLGFAEKTDISAIYNFDAGIMHISELPTFFEKYSNPAFARRPAPWIQQTLQRLPTWDKIFTTDREWINGVIADHDLSFKSTDGHYYTIPYAQVQSLTLKRGGTFSAYDDMTITYTSGRSQSFQSVGGEVHLNRFKGEQQTHKLRNVEKLVVGIANK